MTADSLASGCFCAIKNKSRAILFHFNMSAAKLSQAAATFFQRVATTLVTSTKVFEHLEGSVNTKTYPGLKQLILPGDTKRLNFFFFFDTLG